MIRTLGCPVCEDEVRMGIPDGATIQSISTEPREEPEDPGKKVREIACEAEHHFFVFFEM